MKYFLVYRDNPLFAKHNPQIFKGVDVVSSFIVPHHVNMGDNGAYLLKGACGKALQASYEGAKTIICDRFFDELGDLHLPVELNDSGNEGVLVRRVNTYDLLSGGAGCGGRAFKKSLRIDYMFERSIASSDRPREIDVGKKLSWLANKLTGKRVVSKVVLVKYRMNHGEPRYSEEDARRFGVSCVQSNSDGDWFHWVWRQMSKVYRGSRFVVVDTLDDAMIHAKDSEALIVVNGCCDEGLNQNLSLWSFPSMLLLLPMGESLRDMINRGVAEFTFNFSAVREALLA